MRLSELTGKELINLVDGSKRGQIRKIDFMVDLKKALVISMILPEKGFFFRMEQEISWAAVKKISDDLVLLEYEPSKEEKKGNYLGLSKKGN